MAVMTTRNPVPGDIDTTRPNVARVYDYLLGGKDNFAADREAAKLLLEALPTWRGIVRDNRAFIGRVVRYLAAEAASGSSSTSAAACPPRPTSRDGPGGRADARVVYVDNDPVVWSHGKALLARRAVAMIHADMRTRLRSWGILSSALIDLTARWR